MAPKRRRHRRHHFRFGGDPTWHPAAEPAPVGDIEVEPVHAPPPDPSPERWARLGAVLDSEMGWDDADEDQDPDQGEPLQSAD